MNSGPHPLGVLCECYRVSAVLAVFVDKKLSHLRMVVENRPLRPTIERRQL